jgi:hypothetical protein
MTEFKCRIGTFRHEDSFDGDFVWRELVNNLGDTRINLFKSLGQFAFWDRLDTATGDIGMGRANASDNTISGDS